MNQKNELINWAKPLAQDYVVIDRIPDPETITDAPSLVRLASGKLLCVFPIAVHPDSTASTKGFTGVQRLLTGTLKRFGNKALKLFSSSDEGKTWKEIHAPLEFWAGRLFLHDSMVYYIGTGPERKGIRISCSDDEGNSWLPPVTLFHGLFYSTATGMAEANDKLYWAFGAPNEEGHFNTTGSRSAAIVGDLSKDLMDPASWRISPYLPYPGTPAGLSREIYEYRDHYLEPNVVNVKGKIRVILRPRIDRYTTSNIAVICDVTDDGEKLDYKFTQFYPLPGGQNQFHIIYDEASDLFWMTSNPPTNTQDEKFAEELAEKGFFGKPGNERRFLMLFYSVDALNWFQACCIAMWPSPMQAFNYTTPLIDGDDLLIVSRTSKDGRNLRQNLRQTLRNTLTEKVH